MWVYIKSEPNLYTVGFYDPKGEWHPSSDHDNSEDAARRCAWLNGVDRETGTEPEAGSYEEYQHIKQRPALKTE